MSDSNVQQNSDHQGEPNHAVSLHQTLGDICSIGAVPSGVVIRYLEDGPVEVLAIHPVPESNEPPAWLSAVAIEARALNGEDPKSVIEIEDCNVVFKHLAVSDKTNSRTVIAIYHTADADKFETLSVLSGLLVADEAKLSAFESQAAVARLASVVECAGAMGSYDRARTAAFSLVNHIESHWSCSRVSVGFVEEQYIAVLAMSNTEEILRKMEAVRLIESAMEECADQATEVEFPRSVGSRIVRATKELASKCDDVAVLSVPLHYKDEVFAVITLERQSGEIFTDIDVDSIRLLGELVQNPLSLLHRHDRWWGRRCTDFCREKIEMVLGPEHTWIKLAGVIVVLLLCFMLFGKGTYRVEGTFTVGVEDRAVIAVPFDGEIMAVHVRPGDVVVSGETVLLEFDTIELELQLATTEASLAKAQREVSVAQREHDEATAKMARSDVDKAQAEIDLLNHRLGISSAVAPISGHVLSGDLERLVGLPVSRGEILMELAPLESFYADIFVNQSEILDVEVGQEGEVATAAYPGHYISLVVEAIEPLGQVGDMETVFRVRAKLTNPPAWLRPGMEGVAKVNAGRKHYIVMWTKPVIDWLRMWLWI
ncbi:MAG: HlyD family efflux transporter periplasmic adaptor subunit [Phycisphaerae bacterium]|nr:HlyD family efflux transporter periplasmic adaptor subunit [Phycisphaerae bacterium]HJN72059.1 HlyD family efflux transporter periplasmic adaptor subunit [Phycisphaerales bacterium]